MIMDYSYHLLYIILITGIICWIPANFVVSSPIVQSLGSIVNVRKLIKEQQTSLALGAGASNYLAKFQVCFLQQGEKIKYHWETKAEYLFSVEGEDLIFNCGPCSPPSKRHFWRWVTFEGVDAPLNRNDDDNDEKEEDTIAIPINYNITSYQELILISPKPDLSTFYCFWEDKHELDGSLLRVISKIWTVEIVSVAHMKKVSVRSWRKAGIQQSEKPVNLDVASSMIRVDTTWSKWSACSRCGGKTGKKYKTGFCSVNQLSSRGRGTMELEAFKLYKAPLSCSLLIDFHPDILSQSSSLRNYSITSMLNHALGRPHTIMVAYCKVRRIVCGVGEDKDVVIKNKVIAGLYEEYEMKGDGGDKSDEGGSWSARRILWMMKHLVGGIPFGWNNLPELVALVALVSLQIYVIYLILKWRSGAH